MADPLDDRLKRWIESTLSGASVSLGPPEAQPSGRGVGLYLLDALPSSPLSTAKPLPLQLTLRYLVTAWSEDLQGAHDLLVRLLFAAMENSDLEVERNAPPLELWRAFGVRPQPGFFLRAAVLQERPRGPVKLVRQPIKVELVSRVAFYGRVLGPEDTPLSNCFVEVPALGFSTSTDNEGRFAFGGLPADRNTRFIIKARGREISVDSEQNFPDSATPMIIRFSSLED